MKIWFARDDASAMELRDVHAFRTCPKKSRKTGIFTAPLAGRLVSDDLLYEHGIELRPGECRSYDVTLDITPISTRGRCAMTE